MCCCVENGRRQRCQQTSVVKFRAGLWGSGGAGVGVGAEVGAGVGVGGLADRVEGGPGAAVCGSWRMFCSSESVTWRAARQGEKQKVETGTLLKAIIACSQKPLSIYRTSKKLKLELCVRLLLLLHRNLCQFIKQAKNVETGTVSCLLYTSPSPRDFG